MSKNNKLNKEDRKLVNELFWNSFLLESSYNYERQQALGYACGMWPAIKRYYHTKEQQAEALVRHMAIFNTTPHLVSTISGISAVLEKEASENPNFDRSIINNVKIGLMGPLAGIGDSFFWGTLRIIAAGIGISLSQQGSIMGPILFLLIFNIPHIIIRYYGTVVGYKFGTSLMGNAKDTGILQMISKGATIVGLMVIGAMSASMVAMSTPFSIKIGETAFKLQTYLDQIFPLLLPLLYTLAMFGLLKKGCKPTTILLITIVVGILGAALGIL
ncbi:MAG: PTS system mannose/fructose/sorbose family transporter subunit IID [Erysipelotrichaceae bacterium]